MAVVLGTTIPVIEIGTSTPSAARVVELLYGNGSSVVVVVVMFSGGSVMVASAEDSVVAVTIVSFKEEVVVVIGSLVDMVSIGWQTVSHS